MHKKACSRSTFDCRNRCNWPPMDSDDPFLVCIYYIDGSDEFCLASLSDIAGTVSHHHASSALLKQFFAFVFLSTFFLFSISIPCFQECLCIHYCKVILA